MRSKLTTALPGAHTMPNTTTTVHHITYVSLSLHDASLRSKSEPNSRRYRWLCGMSDERTWRWSLTALSPREWMQRVLLVLLVFVCLFGDFLLWQQVLLPDWSFLRHLIDSATHFAVGFFSWGIFLCFSHDWRIPSATNELPVLDESATSHQAEIPGFAAWRGFLLSCLFAGVTAAFLDIDHFIAAGALSISGATHLEGRPFGHAVTFIIAVVLLVCLYSTYTGASKWRRIHRICFVLVTLLSHQIRDANRRGLWFWPIGSTPGIFYPIYIFMEIALPIVLARWQITDGRSENDASANNAPRTNPTNDSVETTRSSRDDEDAIDVVEPHEHTTPAPGTAKPPPSLF